MAKIPEYYEVGQRENISPEELLRVLEDMYKDLAIAINKKPDIYIRTVDGQSSDSFLNNGDININSSTNKVEMLTNRPTANTVTWTTLG